MKTLALAAIIVTSAALSGSAYARTFAFHGGICRPINTNLSGADYDQFGINNAGNSLNGHGLPATVECPLPLDYPDSGPVPTVTLVETKVYNRSVGSNFSCALEQVNDDGVILVSVTSGASFGGSAPIDMSFVPPPGSPASGYWRLRCSIPSPKNGGSLVGPVVHTSE